VDARRGEREGGARDEAGRGRTTGFAALFDALPLKYYDTCVYSWENDTSLRHPMPFPFPFFFKFYLRKKKEKPRGGGRESGLCFRNTCVIIVII